MPNLPSDRRRWSTASAALRSLGTAAAGAILSLFVTLCSAVAGEQSPPRSVLFLDQFEEASPFSSTIFSSFRSSLNSDPARPVSVYVERLDLGRFGGPPFEQAMTDFFHEKYRNRPIGVMVAIGSSALELALRLRKGFAPDAPIIFAAVDEEPFGELERPRNVTGRTIRLNLADEVSIAQALVPALKRVAIVGDPPERQFIRRQVSAQMTSLATRFKIMDLTDLTMRELRTRVAALPSDSAIIYTGLVSDAEQVAYTSHDALVSIAEAANRPIIVQAETHIGAGATGGIVASPTRIGRETAELASRVLAGESASSIPITTGNVMKAVFDWRQLQRWGVSEDKLPAGSEVRFRELTIWERSRVQIVAVVAAVLLQSALITWLLFEHRRRNVAEVTARNMMSELYQMNRVATAGELSASIAHEVNQPLTGIVTRANAAARWLKAETLDVDKARVALTQILRAAYRASEVIAGVRAMFQRDTEDQVAVDINRLILTVLRIVRIDLRKHEIELEMQLGDGLPPVSGNPVQLQQVMLNLVMNAIDAMHSASNRILHIKSERTDDGAVCVSVEDTGAGIDPSDLNRIFKPLFTTKSRGMGMGLSICRSIVEGHNGQIWVSPRATTGSIFRFELPASTGV